MHVHHAITVPASPERVWELTVDIEHWPDWMPTVRRVTRHDSGQPCVGSRATVEQPMRRPAVWTVTTLEPNHRFSWSTPDGDGEMLATHVIERLDHGCVNTLTIDLTRARRAPARWLLAWSIRLVLRRENRALRRTAAHRSRTGMDSAGLLQRSR